LIYLNRKTDNSDN